jgi:lipase
VTELLAVHAWGDERGPRAVCLHGVTSWGGHFARLAEALGGDRQVVAPDLLGHGRSRYEPPWDADAHVEAVLATVGTAPSAWIGHSFGARIAFEVAARVPEAVERLVLLDPALHLEPHVALFAAENARAERSYASFDEAVDRRFTESSLERAPRALVEEELRLHLAPGPDGRWRYRYSQAAVVAAYSVMASAPPPFSSARVPTLLVVGEGSYLSYDHLLPAHAGALGDLLRVARVPGGHTVLWDALAETGTTVARFLDAG